MKVYDLFYMSADGRVLNSHDAARSPAEIGDEVRRCFEDGATWVEIEQRDEAESA